jgi:hypothetical protein
VVVRNPFNPFMTDLVSPPATVTNLERRDPFAPFETAAPQTVVNLEKRADMAAKALAQAERDLEAARERASVDDDREEKLEKRRRQVTLAERARILAILINPVALRQPRLAEKFALESDVPARDAITAMEAADRVHAENTAKSTADLILLAGQMRRAEVAVPVTGVGPKNFVKTTAEEILTAARKARGED